MIKNNKWKLIVASAVLLLPMVVGAIFWKRLPEQMAVHWGLDMKVDGWASPATVVFLLPCIFLAIYWLCILITAYDNRKRRQSKKVEDLIIWLLPVISLVVNGAFFAVSLGYELQMSFWMLMTIGAVFVFVGNYLPKSRRNRTIGIKLKWTLANEENWNKTHRFGGRVWVICGILTMLCAFLPTSFFPAVSLILIALATALPTVYSYVYFKKQLSRAEVSKEDLKGVIIGSGRLNRVISIVLVGVVLIICLLICFTGNIGYEYGEASLLVKADHYTDLTVQYDDIEEITLREEGVGGTRVYGFGTPRLLMGHFKNKEQGDYIRYTYASEKCCVMLNVKGKTVVLGCKDREDTVELYNELLKRIPKEG